MERMNVTAGDTRDEEGRLRFLPFPLEDHIFNDIRDNVAANYLRDWTFYPIKQVFSFVKKRYAYMT